MATFRVSESFKVPTVPRRSVGRKIDSDCVKEFWTSAGDYAELRGCYVFSMKAGQGERPWYVGKASVLLLGKEAFSDRNLGIYNDVITDYKGTPRMTFVTAVTGKGPVPQVQIDEVEEYLIGYAATRNSDLINKRKLPNQKWSIQGVVASTVGKPTAAAAAFRTLMGI